MIGTIPVVVLDLDGVANHQRLYDANLARGTPTPPEGWIDRECIARINTLCERTGARIVISSSWRTYETIRGQPVGGLVGTVAVLRACGLTAEVIGATPDHATPEQRERHQRADRWPEIHEWLAAHPEVGAWVVLDDSELPGVPAESFVRTDIAVGITDADVERAVRILSAPAVTFDREVDGRWIADVEALPGVLAYGATQDEARANVEALAARVLAEQATITRP